MKTAELTAAIEAYASAKTGANGVLLMRQGKALQDMLQTLQEERPDNNQPAIELPTPSA